jgi:hypothetical protein
MESTLLSGTMLEEERARKDQGISPRDRKRAAAIHQSSPPPGLIPKGVSLLATDDTGEKGIRVLA